MLHAEGVELHVAATVAVSTTIHVKAELVTALVWASVRVTVAPE